VARPRPGWRGIVDCEVLEVREPSLLRFSFTYEHTGFTGAGGFLLAQLLGSVRRKMLTIGLPAVLQDLKTAEDKTADA